MKLLIVRLGSLGDIIHAVPAQQMLTQHFPQAEIHWLTEPPYDALLHRIPGIHKLWLADTKKWRRKPFSVGEGIRLVRSLRRQRFDAALDFQGLIKSALLAKLSGARRIIGFAAHQSREPASRYFYSETVEADDGSRPHAVEINLALAQSLGCSNNGASPLIPLDIPTEAFGYVDEQLRRNNVSNPVLVNPGAGWVTKHWPPENYAKLIRRIHQEMGHGMILTYGPGEQGLVEKIRTLAKPHPIASFPTTFLQLAALCRRARLLVAGDTGPLHLAVALGTPTVAILGPTSPWRNGPFNPQDPIVKRYLFCSNSYKRSCNQFICMDIPVQEVFDAVTRRLGS